MTNLEFYKEEIKNMRTSYYNKETSAAEDLGLALLEVHQKYAPMSTDVLDWLNSKYQILTEKECEYLDNIIDPFRNKVVSIAKYRNHTLDKPEYVEICYRSVHDDTRQLILPEFEQGSVFKGMKLNKLYKLAELGLEKVEVCTNIYDY